MARTTEIIELVHKLIPKIYLWLFYRELSFKDSVRLEFDIIQPRYRGRKRENPGNEALCLFVTLFFCFRRNFLTLVVQLTISFILSFIKQVNTTGTSSGLSRKVWVTAYKGDAYWAVNL